MRRKLCYVGLMVMLAAGTLLAQFTGDVIGTHDL